MKFIRKEGKLQTTPTNTTFLPPLLPPHFSRAHAVPWTLNFFSLILPLCARLNSISIHAHAKSAPNSLFDPVRATIIYIYMHIRVRTTLIPHAPPYTRNSFHIPRIYSNIFDGSQILFCTIAKHSLLVERGRRSFSLVTSIASLLEYREFIEAEGTFE